MKRFAITTFSRRAAIGFGCVAAQAQVGVSATIGGFYDELAPYGRWVDCRYGRCWVPRQVAAAGSRTPTADGSTRNTGGPGCPVTHGEATLTTTGPGPTLRGYGWSWVPGTVWAPAWVTWSYSDSYVGWAPLPPTVVFGASGYAGRPVVVSQTQYVFVPTNRFVDTERHFGACPGAGERGDIPADETGNRILGFRAVSSGIRPFRWRQLSVPPGGKIETQKHPAPPIRRHAR